MVLKDILAISGEPGLFKFIAQGKNAIIIEHLETKKRSSAFGSAKVSSLDEISIFTEKEDLPLAKVFDLIFDKESGGAAIDAKSEPEKLKAYFENILPEYDKNKVYASDIKKVLNWYNILHRLNLLVREEPEKPDEAPAEKPEKLKGETAKKKKAPAKSRSEKPLKSAGADKKKPAKPKAK
jgi:hypothetical protein